MEVTHKRRTRDKDARLYELEYRVRPEKATFGLWKPGWHRYWKRYRTAEERDEARLLLNRKDTLFEWRTRDKSSQAKKN
jgi:hypothetical protein